MLLKSVLKAGFFLLTEHQHLNKKKTQVKNCTHVCSTTFISTAALITLSSYVKDVLCVLLLVFKREIRRFFTKKVVLNSFGNYFGVHMEQYICLKYF